FGVYQLSTGQCHIHTPQNCQRCGDVCQSGICELTPSITGDYFSCRPSCGGLSCPPRHDLPQVMRSPASSCQGSVCQLSCIPGFQHCSDFLTDGCESYAPSDFYNCGSCGRRCTSGEACIMGVCRKSP